jgi:L-serine dehydratase
MKAARQFALFLEGQGVLIGVQDIQVELFGSLALTGRGHGTDKAILLGLEGAQPEKIETENIDSRLALIYAQNSLNLLGQKQISFNEDKHLIFNQQDVLPHHINGMRFTAFVGDKGQTFSKIYYSVGGGFIISEDDLPAAIFGNEPFTRIPYPFRSAEELLAICESEGLQIWQVMLENEKVFRSEQDIRDGILHIWQVMQNCVQRGYIVRERLPGGMNIKRRAPDLYEKLTQYPEHALRDPLTTMDWVNLYALAVSEENAAGG